MIDRQRATNLIESALMADSYCLGLHWIYDHDLLDSGPLDNSRLNAPLSHWHGAKGAGDMTHYGDQLWHLYRYFLSVSDFDIDLYRQQWSAFMLRYHGYLDKASACTLDNMTHGIEPSGSASTELSVTARIACPLLHNHNPETYLEQVETLTRMTHDSDLAVAASRFLAATLWHCLQGQPLKQAIADRIDSLPSDMQAKVHQGIESAASDTVTSLRHFGIACDIHHGLPGVMHLLHRYSDPVLMLQENARAGGDSSARAMVAILLLIAEHPECFEKIPADWQPTCLQH